MITIFKSFWANLDGEAWLRFLIAIAGLGLAFAAAVFSSAARESGNMLATAIFASSALFLAAVVGLTTVPYLARRVAATRVRDALHYELTREGMAYLGTALVIGIAALNTANNLLFIVLAAMLAAIIVSGLGSAAVLRRLELDLAMPQNAFAGKPVAVRVRLTNPRLWMPAFSVKVFTPTEKKKRTVEWEWSKTEFIFPRKKQWFRLPDLTLRRRDPVEKPSEILSRPVYFTYLAPRDTAEAQVELIFPRRGLYSQDSFSVATRFPFSFLIKSRKIDLQRDMLVYPARYLDWKATAKTGSLKVREYSREDERRLRIVFDNPEPGRATATAYERAVSLAATLACHFNTENIELSFAGSEYGGGMHLEDFLRYLAVVHPAKSTESVLETLPVSSDFNVILTARTPGTLPSALWFSSYVIYM